MTEPIVVGVGGNIGTDAEIIERFARARVAFEQLGAVRSASLYKTAAIGPEQPDFLNTALRVRISDIPPAELIATVLEIERQCGRDRRDEPRFGPRAIDLDVLVWGHRSIATDELRVPHPRLHERRFALAPLTDLVGEAFEIPGIGTVGHALLLTRFQRCQLIAPTW